MADVAAKDGSQETAVNLLALIIGFFLVSPSPSPFPPFDSLFLLLSILYLIPSSASYNALLLPDPLDQHGSRHGLDSLPRGHHLPHPS